MEEELRQKEEVREQLSAAEKRGIQLNGELEELRTQMEMSERARKSAESELNDAADRVSELLAANASLTSTRRKLEADMHAMQVRKWVTGRQELTLIVDDFIKTLNAAKSYSFDCLLLNLKSATTLIWLSWITHCVSY